MNIVLDADLSHRPEEGSSALLRRIGALATVGVDRPAVEALEAQAQIAERHRTVAE
jgi:hypothetical protein